MPGRKYSTDGAYRYGFNGKENDNEVKGEGNQQDYGMRIYDPRLGRFLSVDPLTRSYPMLTPYQFASNKPINSIDLDGGESKEVYQFYDVSGKLTSSYSVDVNDPHDLGSGTLYHIYTIREVTSKQINAQTVEVQQRTIQNDFYVPPSRNWLQQIGDWLSGKIPQVMVFGSGTDMSGNNGSTPNYKRRLYSFNFKEFNEMMELIGQGWENPDLKEVEPGKVPELTQKLFDQVAEENPDDEDAKKLKETNGTNPTPRIEPGNSIDSKFKTPGNVVYRRYGGFKTEILDSTGRGRVTEKPPTDTVP